MNYIIRKQTDRMPFHTLLGGLVESFGGLHEKYNWLITDYETFSPCLWSDDELSSSPKFFSGKELTKLAAEFPDCQIIWGVITGLPLNIVIDPKHLVAEPVAENGTTFWKNPPKPQYPGAIVEIIAWDSTYTLFISTDIELSSSFYSYFPEAEKLEEFNQSHNSNKGD